MEYVRRKNKKKNIVIIVSIICIVIAGFFAYKLTTDYIAKKEKEAEIQRIKEEKLAQKKKEEAERNKVKPISGLYPKMVVKKQEFTSINPDEKIVYITFDDGPWAETERLLDMLDTLDIKVTFFVSGQFGSDKEIINNLKEISKRGHEVAVHSYSHDYKTIYSSVEEYLKDYKKMDDLIVKATGKRSSVYRYPGGSNNGYAENIRNELLKEMNSRNLVYHDWNAFDGDTEGYSASQMVERAVRECSSMNRSILLMHDLPAKKEVVDALPEIVRQLKEKGYRFEKLDGTVEPIQFSKPQ